jgi:glycosidase
LDGFRLDAVKHIIPSFWWKFRAGLRERIEEKRGMPLYLVGETFKDRAGIMSFVGPNMLDGQFDFPLYDSIKDSLGVGSANLQSLDDAMTASERSYGSPALMSPLIGNHDKGRFMAYADGELPDSAFAKEEEVGWQKPPKVRDPANYAKLELAQALLMSVDGVPMVYYGDEIGMTGAGDPDNRRDMRFGDQVTADEKPVLEHFGKLTALRRVHPALRYGSRRTLLRDNDCLAFVRAYFDDRVLVILNRSKSPRDVVIDPNPEMTEPPLKNLLTGDEIALKDGKLSINVPGSSALFIGSH